MATRTVEVPAKGKREAFSFEYDAPENFQAAIQTLGGQDKAFEAILAYLDHAQIAEHTTAVKEAAMLSATFKQSLKYLSKAMGSVDKALPILLSSGGFESLTEDEVNTAVEEVKNPTPRKKRTPKTPAAA